MKSLLIVFFVVLFILLILFFPFKIRIASHINLLSLKAFYCFKLWRFKFLCGKAEVKENGKFLVENSNNMFSSEMDKGFALKLGKQILSKLDVKKIEIFFTGGFEEDSYTSAIMCGSVTSMVRSAYSVLSQKYENVKMYEDIVPTFFETNLELTFDIVISISLFQIFISLLKANKLKEKEYERKKLYQ